MQNAMYPYHNPLCIFFGNGSIHRSNVFRLLQHCICEFQVKLKFGLIKILHVSQRALNGSSNWRYASSCSASFKFINKIRTSALDMYAYNGKPIWIAALCQKLYQLHLYFMQLGLFSSFCYSSLSSSLCEWGVTTTTFRLVFWHARRFHPATTLLLICVSVKFRFIMANQYRPEIVSARSTLTHRPTTQLMICSLRISRVRTIADSSRNICLHRPQNNRSLSRWARLPRPNRVRRRLQLLRQQPPVNRWTGTEVMQPRPC